MNEITKPPSEEKEGPMPVVRKPDIGKIELVTPKPLVAYDGQTVKPRKRGALENRDGRRPHLASNLSSYFWKILRRFRTPKRNYSARFLSCKR